MALQGNPFLGKLKIPAPDLSHIPETPFNGPAPKPTESAPSTSPKENSELKPDRVQTGSGIGFNRVQTGSGIGFNRVQKTRSESIIADLNPFEPVLDRVQTGSVTGSDSTFKQPAYGELAVLRYFADREGVVGAPIYTRRREIAVGTCQTINGVKTALRRLREADIIQLNEYERGPNRGITSYRLTQKAHEILASKMAIDRLGFNRVQTGSVTGSNGFLSSSSKDLNTTTTTEGAELLNCDSLQLGPEWLSIELSPLADVRFMQGHLIQIIRQGKLTSIEVQDSIDFFAFDLKRNGKGKEIKGPPLNFFMGILRKGLPYAPPDNYESPADEARRKRREFLEQKEGERQATEQRILALEFGEWKRGLSVDELMRLVPDFARRPGPVQDSALKSYFESQIWTQRMHQIENSTGSGE